MRPATRHGDLAGREFRRLLWLRCARGCFVAGLALGAASVAVLPPTAEGTPSRQQLTPVPAVPTDDPARGMVFAGLRPATSGKCRGLFEVIGAEMCTHGPDPGPEGLDVRTLRPAVTAVPAAARVAPHRVSSVACDGDGSSGKRVHTLYVRAADRPDRYSDLEAQIESWVADMDDIYFDSAARSGGMRRVRIAHDANCVPIVDNVTVPPTADDGFGATIDAVKALGFDRGDRKYLMFVDSNVYCGIGSLYSDDRPGQNNYNDGGPSYSRVDAGCWGGPVAAHEIMHNIGGVQNSAPNASGGYHCTDDYDRMCYSDSPNYPTMQVVCSPSETNERLLDCGHNDYFSVNPTPGSYLDTHWNAANSSYLLIPTPISPTPTPPGVPVVEAVTIDVVELTGNGNGVADPGERFGLMVHLHNGGTAPALDVTGALDLVDGAALVESGAAAWDDLAVGATGASATPYVIEVPPGAPCAAALRFEHVVSYAGSDDYVHAVKIPLGRAEPIGSVTFAFAGAPVPIPDLDATGATASVYVDAAGAVLDVDVGVEIRHSWVADLELYLVAPSGRRIALALRRGGSGDDFAGTWFDDEATPAIGSGAAPFTGMFKPDEVLGGLDAREPARGTWKLWVVDRAGADVGTIDGFRLAVTTGGVAGVEYVGGPVPVPDDDDTGAVATVVVSGTGRITDLDVSVVISHTYTADLTLELVSPAQTTVTLAQARGGSGDDFAATVFDDEAPTPIGDGTAPFVGRFSPDDALSVLDGEFVEGVWQLRVIDGVGADVGTINAVGLLIRSRAVRRTTYAAGPVPIPDDDPAGAEVQLDVDVGGMLVDADIEVGITHTWDADLALRVFSPAGESVLLANDVGGSGNDFSGTVFDDAAATPIGSGSPPFTGRFRPQGLLADLVGGPNGGTWRLHVVDDAGADVGTIDAFAVEAGADAAVCEVFTLAGDCNADGAVDAADLAAAVLELFDGDGRLPEHTAFGTFAGNAAGCNANRDDRVDAGDLACVGNIVYGNPSCVQ